MRQTKWPSTYSREARDRSGCVHFTSPVFRSIAAQLGVVGVAAAGAVQKAVVVDARVPVRLHGLVPPTLGVGPDDVVAAGTHLQQRAAGAVALGDEHQVADHDRVAGVDALQASARHG